MTLHPDAPRHRVVGLVGATGLIVAAMIGSGIFTLTGMFGASVGSDANVIAAWTIGGMLALAGGLSMAELGAMIPCSGGSVEFARRAFGGTVGYLVAMVTVFAGYFLAIAAVGLMLAEYVNRLLPSPLPVHAIAAAAIALAALSQWPRLGAGIAFNTALSAFKIGFVALFVVAGLAWPAPERLVAAATDLPPETPGLLSPAVASATLAVSFAYLGWSTGADVAGDVRDPGRTVPRSIVFAVGIVFVLYLGVNLVYLRVIAPAAMLEPNGAPLQAIGSVVATRLFGDAVGGVMTAAIAMLLFSTMLSGTITAARILESMAHAREIPSVLGTRSPGGVPRAGLLATAIASLGCLALGNLDDLFGLLTVLINVFSSLSVAAVIVLRRTMPDAPRPFRVPLYPFTPLLYLALAGWSIVASVIDGGWYAVLSSLAAVAMLLLIRPLLALGRRSPT